MADKPMPETLETLVAHISSLSARVDRQFEETRAQLGVKIEAVDTKVTQVYDAVIALRDHHKENVKRRAR